MSDSPPKETDVEQSAQSGEEENHMDREPESTQQGLGDFEVKEQDRWLPIANGWLRFIPDPVVAGFDLLVPCVTYCVFACLTIAFVRIQRVRFESDLFATSAYSSRPHSTPAMIYIAAQLSLVRCV
jgi:hypothetical protein